MYRILSLYESAIIAGLIKAPSRYAPTSNSELSGNRAYQVLLSMAEEGFINPEQLQNAATTPVALNTEMLGSKNRNHFTEWVYEQVADHVTENDKDVIVKTTFDSRIHALVEKTLQKQLDAISEKRKVHEGAVVILDYEGKVISMVGGRDFRKSSFNRATQAIRPPGSAFKTFVYAAAIESGWDYYDVIEDRPLEFSNGWAPKNFNKDYLGYITLEEAFARSINTVAVQLAEQVGVYNVVRMARRMGIQSPLNHNLAIALGASSVNLLEMTSSYGAVGNYGYKVTPSPISYVRNTTTGEMIYVNPAPAPQKVMSDRTAEIMQYLLANTVERGTARNALSYFRISGKTGTSQDFRDAWFVGYTDQYIIGVWLGNDDYSPTKYVSGGIYPTIIARDILRAIKKKKY